MAGKQGAIASFVRHQQLNAPRSDPKYNTGAFTNDDLTIIPTESVDKKSAVAANICGFYFEAEVYRALSALADGGGDESDFSDGQRNATSIFENSTSPRVAQLGAEIRNAAAKTAEEWYKYMVNELQETDFQVKIIADTELLHPYSGRPIRLKSGEPIMIGNPVGDLQIIVGGKTITLELKWQTASGAVLHYFHSVGEDALFGGGFRNYLAEHARTYWSHIDEEKDWKIKIGYNALSDFLHQQFNNDRAILTYLLGKGETVKKYNMQQDGKIVIRGTSASLTIMDIESLAQAIVDASSGTAAKTWSSNINGKRAVSGAGIAWTKDEEEIAAFGIKSFRGAGIGQAFKAKKAKTQQERALASISKAQFTYQMFINQKIFNDNVANGII